MQNWLLKCSVNLNDNESSFGRKMSNTKSLTYKILLLFNCLALGIGSNAGPLLLRFYFLHGGKRLWLTAWLQTAGFPILLLPICISSCRKKPPSDSHVTPKIFLACVVVGILTGLDDFFFAWGFSYLPVSTIALVSATQLAFNAVFAFLLVNQKFTPYSINAVILLIMGPVLLGFHSSSDRPKGVTTGQYWLGFVVTIAATALYGFILPLIELVYKKTNCKITYLLVMEMQLIMSFSATAFCTIGMVINKDFQAIGREASAFDVGELNYYIALAWNAICWQLFFIGVYGVIFLTSSLMSGILLAVFIPMTEMLAVIIYHEKFSGEKGMALAMALWGFASYFYGEHRASKSEPNNMAEENRPGPESSSIVGGEESAVELIVQHPNPNKTP